MINQTLNRSSEMDECVFRCVFVSVLRCVVESVFRYVVVSVFRCVVSVFRCVMFFVLMWVVSFFQPTQSS